MWERNFVILNNRYSYIQIFCKTETPNLEEVVTHLNNDLLYKMGHYFLDI